MGLQIEDGKGRGNVASVDGNKRQDVRAISSDAQEAATDIGNSYNLNSGSVSTSVATEQGILYFKNNEARDFKITGIVAIIGASTNGTEVNVKIYKNPTAGTLISDATAADTNSNRNFGSTKSLSATVYKGDGATSTVTDGTVHIESIIPTASRVFFTIDEVIPNGKSIAMTYTITLNDSATTTMGAIIGYLKDPNETGNGV